MTTTISKLALWRRNNKDKVKVYNLKYYKANKRKLKARARRRYYNKKYTKGAK